MEAARDAVLPVIAIGILETADAVEKRCRWQRGQVDQLLFCVGKQAEAASAPLSASRDKASLQLNLHAVVRNLKPLRI